MDETTTSTNRAPEVSLDGIGALFSPRRVAVVGASLTSGKLGHDVLVECARRGFVGQMIGVNPRARGEEIAGWPVVPSLEEAGEIDLALVATSAGRTLEAVSDCARAGVRAAVLAAAGFGELGAEGAAVEAEILRLARQAGMRMVGPNGIGLFVDRLGLNLMGWRDVPSGRVAVVSQSGNVAIALSQAMRRMGLGLSSCVGLGNQLDVGAADILAHHAGSPDCDAVALYLEGLRGDGRSLARSLALCREAGKPVVVLKAGRTEQGRRSVATHTAALGGSAAIWDSMLTEAGAALARDPEEMVDILAALQGLGARRRIHGALLLTDGGGDSVLSLDALQEAGVPLARLSPSTQEQLRLLAPPASPRAPGENPVTLDTAGGLEDDPRLLARCAVVGASDDSVDAVIISGTFGGYRERRREELETVDELAAIKQSGVPVLVHSAFAFDDEESVKRLREEAIPVFSSTRRLATALSHLLVPSLPPATGQTSKASGGEALGYEEAAALLRSVGVKLAPYRVVHDRDELGRALGEIGAPLCLKVEDPAISHKSDVGGVRLGLSQEGAAEAAEELWSRFGESDLLVMPMLDRGFELLVGTGHDPTFGPFVTVGRGGVTAELEPDVAMGLAPLSKERARELLGSLRCRPLLEGFRGHPGVDVESLVELLVAFSELARSESELSIECNPVMAYEKGYAVADLRAMREVPDGSP